MASYQRILVNDLQIIRLLVPGKLSGTQPHQLFPTAGTAARGLSKHGQSRFSVTGKRNSDRLTGRHVRHQKLIDFRRMHAKPVSLQKRILSTGQKDEAVFVDSFVVGRM